MREKTAYDRLEKLCEDSKINKIRVVGNEQER
jgi:hypothetical protein